MFPRVVLAFVAGLSVSAHASTLTVLREFSGADGAFLNAGLIQDAEGNLIGTAQSGGTVTGAAGTIFKLAPDGSAFTLLHQFSVFGGGGTFPFSGLVADSSGNFYGTTARGGTNPGPFGFGLGTVFRLNAGGGVSTLHSFDGVTGERPIAGLALDGDGNLFGTTLNGGSSGFGGTVFRIGTEGSNFSTLHSFSNFDGSNPWASLVASADGTLFGTTDFGGVFNRGTIFRIAPDGSNFSLLHSFGPGDGFYPRASLLIDASGKLFGVTTEGGANDLGTVFRIGIDGSGFTTLHSFSGADGATPYGRLVFHDSGYLFGTTYAGGVSDNGTIFRIRSDGAGFALIHSFSGPDGRGPVAGLTAGLGGALFGTTQSGGAGDVGVIFRLDVPGDDGGAIPEPDQWMLMIAGFGLVGARLRTRRHRKLNII